MKRLDLLLNKSDFLILKFKIRIRFSFFVCSRLNYFLITYVWALSTLRLDGLV